MGEAARNSNEETRTESWRWRGDGEKIERSYSLGLWVLILEIDRYFVKNLKRGRSDGCGGNLREV